MEQTTPNSESTNSQTVYSQALQLFESSEYEDQQTFARTVLEHYVSDALENNTVERRIQDGLQYEPDYDELLEEWIDSIIRWDIRPASDSISQQIGVYVEAHTLDTAIINAEAAHFPPSLCSEHRTYVDCYVECELVLTPLVVNDSVRITIVRQ